MKRSALYSLVRSSLLAIGEPRLFQTERGYQSALRTELQNRVNGEILSRADLLVESEYQKAMRHHGLRIRPDLIIHIPYDRDETASRADGNFAAIELKRGGNAAAADAAFANLNAILSVWLQRERDTVKG